MKKFFYTLSFVAAFAVMGQAQTAEPVKNQDSKKVKDDGTLGPATATPPKEDVAPASNTNKKNDEKPRTRMAITEKGVPASKNTEPAKEQKSTEPKKETAPKPEKH